MSDFRSGQVVWIRLSLAALVAGVSGGAHAGDVFHVDSVAGIDAADCGTTVKPCRSIQYAVDVSASDDTIKVAHGTYTSSGSPYCDAVVCIYSSRRVIIGGFSPADWLEYDPDTNLTKVDGENARRVVEVAKGGTDGSPTRLELKGVTITRGRATGYARDAFGGGLRCSNADLVVTDVVFLSNDAVGLDTFSDEGGAAAGGGIHVSSCPDQTPAVPTVELQRVSFVDNRALGGDGPDRGGVALGGAFFGLRAHVSGSDLHFEGNESRGGNSPGGGLAGGVRADALGGAIHLGAAVSATIRGLIAWTNRAVGGSGADNGGFAFGGAIFAEGKELFDEVPGCGAPSESLSTKLSLVDAVVRENESTGGNGHTPGGGKGGGLASFGAVVVLDRSFVLGNQSEGGSGDVEIGEAAGGGVMLEHPDADGSEVRNSFISNNSVLGGSGGGGGVRILGTDAMLFHATLAQNIVGSYQVGQAVLIGPRLGEPAVAQIDFSIIADHSGVIPGKAAVHVLTGATVAFDAGLFAGNDADTNEGMPSAGTFIGMASVKSAASAEFVSPGPPNFDYHLAADSPALDEAGTSDADEDFDHQIRPDDRDLGADERCSVGDGDLVLSDESVATSRLERACDTISALRYEIESGGDVVLQAGIDVVLHSGVIVKSGGSLTVAIELP